MSGAGSDRDPTAPRATSPRAGARRGVRERGSDPSPESDRPLLPARDAALLAGLAVVLAVPFLDQAFHIDDEVYLRLAETLRRQPAEFLRVEQPLFGRMQPLVLHSQHPPLTVAVLALLSAVVSSAEVPLHAAWLSWTILAAWGARAFFSRWTDRPLAAAVLLLVTPAVQVSGHTLMTDLPFLALFVSALALGIRALDGGASRLAAGAGLAASLCALTQYRGLVLPFLLAGYGVARGRPLGRTVPWLLLPFIAVAGWELAALAVWGVVPLLASSGFLSLAPERLAATAATYVAGVGGVLGLVVLVSRRGPAHLAIASGPALLAVLAFRREETVANLGLGLAVFAAGLVLLARPTVDTVGGVRSLLRDRFGGLDDDALLGVGAVVLLGSLVVLSLFACVRNLLVVLPFLLAVLVRRRPEILRGVRVVVAILATAALGLLASASDFAWAGHYRSFAASLAEMDEEVAFAGEWGFRRYLEKAGARYLLETDEDLPTGSLLVVPELASPENAIAPALRERLDRVGDLEVWNPVPLVLMSERRRNCGWYAEAFGVLPFCQGRPPQERLVRYRVKPPVGPGAEEVP